MKFRRLGFRLVRIGIILGENKNEQGATAPSTGRDEMTKQQKKANKNHKLILGLKQLLAEVNTDLTMMPADEVECQIELINQAHLIHTEYKKVVDAWLLDTSVKNERI